MDWGWLYGTLIRTAGWTFEQCGEQSACDVFGYLEHLAEHPPEYLILAAVHMERKPKQMPPQETRQGLSSLMGAPQSMPKAMMDLVAWAESQPGG